MKSCRVLPEVAAVVRSMTLVSMTASPMDVLEHDAAYAVIAIGWGISEHLTMLPEDRDGYWPGQADQQLLMIANVA